ncbi:hypothetical protein, conserved [Leishmania tarentolae]|uniref:B box-type domain-containing protein n=1 Tax=Leishmania tarentolae TaxID=5689 RepID=A0A640KPL3_LEITA|nr:hypothetical protein, conserved [Leishmania tarentolae]
MDSHHSKLCVYHCQLWMETTLTQLEPLDQGRDKVEYDELRAHVARWLGNKHVGFEVQSAMRIRCPFLTRMFDETRCRRLSAHQDKVHFLYYSNNAWGVSDVLQYGFLLSNDVPQSLEAVLQSYGSSDVSSGAQSRPSNPMAHVGSGASARTSPSSEVTSTANTRRTPFIFTSSMLSSHVKYMPLNTAPYKVLLCEVAPGRRFMTDQGLTGESSDKQAYPIPLVKPPCGYDSICYMRARKQKTSLRLEDAAEIAAEDLSFVQVQVQHSYQALPRYLLTVVPSTATPTTKQRRKTGQYATAIPTRAPGTTSQAAAAREDEKKIHRARGASPPLSSSCSPSSSSSLSKTYNMKEWFKFSPRCTTMAVNNGVNRKRASSAAATSPLSTSEVFREVRYAHSTEPRQRAASATRPGSDESLKQRRAVRDTDIKCHKDDIAYRSGNESIGSRVPDPVVARGTGDTGASERVGNLPWGPGLYSAGNGGFRNASPRNDVSHGGARAASAPRAPLTQHPSPLSSSAAQVSPRTNSAWATGDLVLSPSFHDSYNADSTRNRLPDESVPRGHTTKSRDASYPLVPAVHGRRAPGSASSRSPLLPQQEGVHVGDAMVGGVVGPTLNTVLPVSSTVPFPQPQAPPTMLDQFTCDVHLHQIQSLYCTACEESICPYCASDGSHHSHVVVEAAERAKTVCAKAEALHEALHHWLTQCRQTEERLRAVQASNAAQQQQNLRFVQEQFSTLNQALHQAERSMMQTIQEAGRRPPLAEVSAATTKYSQALAAVDAALRRYHSTVIASGSGRFESDTCSPKNGVLELLHFLRTTSPLINKVHDSFALRKHEEKRLRAAIAAYARQVQRNEKLLQHVDWVGARRLLLNIGSGLTNMVNKQEPKRSASSEPVHSSRTASPSVREATDLSIPGATRSGRNSVEVRVRTQTPKTLSSPHADASRAVSQRLLDRAPLDALMHNENGAAASPSTQPSLRLHRCLSDLQRGYIWIIHNATSYFAPGQRKTVCSTPFCLLGVSWELRVAPLPRTCRHDGSASSTPIVEAGINTGLMDTAASRWTPANLPEGGDSGLSGGQAHTSLLVTRSSQGGHDSFAADNAATTLATAPPSSEEGDAEWLGLFLFPLQHCLRMDFRVIVFSEGTWVEWPMKTWPDQFASKGWGVYPFLQRRELMKTSQMVRDNMVKICITPISDLY